MKSWLSGGLFVETDTRPRFGDLEYCASTDVKRNVMNSKERSERVEGIVKKSQ